MIIHQPESRAENGQFIVSARIEHNQTVEFPSELWFSVDEEYAPHVSTRSDIFVSSLFRVARAMGEDVEVRGELSPQLIFGLKEYLKVHAAWSENYDIINISASNLVPAKQVNLETAASCNISGGIDSFYTLWSQLPENESVPELQVKYGIFGLGLSSPFQNDFLRLSYYPKLRTRIRSLGVTLLGVDSNAPLFGYPDPWDLISASRLAIPLLFSRLISLHYIPASHNYKFLPPWGTHPLTDHLFSTESLRIFTHGAELSRYEKLIEFRDWEPMYELLQVCNGRIAGRLNDCTCPKCLQTMMMLEVLGINNRVTTFHLPLQRRRFIGRVIKWKDQYSDLKMMAKRARESRNMRLLPAIYIQLMIFKLTNWVKPLLGYNFQ